MRTPFHVLSHAPPDPVPLKRRLPAPLPHRLLQTHPPPHTHGTRQSRTSRRARRPPHPLNRRLDAEPRTSHALHARTALRTPAQAPFPPEATEKYTRVFYSGATYANPAPGAPAERFTAFFKRAG